ncbi:MAG: DUF1778 domain-containing protein [Vicingaceae bacterium]|nr:DUF1778 domain-containing protein [Vicingaceae bacterium]
MNPIDIKQARFELRLSENDKEILKKACAISGYSTLASFILSMVKKQADQIINEHERILASAKDRKIFFEAVLSTIPPNEKLKNAVKKYTDSTAAE